MYVYMYMFVCVYGVYLGLGHDMNNSCRLSTLFDWKYTVIKDKTMT